MRQTNSTTNQKSEDPPKWPEFGYVEENLELYPLLHDHIFTVSSLFTSKLCRTYVDFLSRLPLSTTPGKPKRGEAVRVNDRFQVIDADFAAKLWSSTALRSLVEEPVVEGRPLAESEKRALWGGEVVGLNPNIRIYRYRPGQHFAQHYDESNNVMVDGQLARTTWTLLLYLTSAATGCDGGQTVFYPEPKNKREAAPSPIVAELEVGMALLHRHGQDCLIHEGREVTKGEKWVIRSDLCVKQ